LSNVSVASKFLVKAGDDKVATKTAEKTNALVSIIYRIHFNPVNGTFPAAASVNLLNIFSEFEQGSTQEIIHFKTEFGTRSRCWKATGAPAMNQDQQTTLVLGKYRQGTFRLHDDRVEK
jgi:hypothetical protein